MRIIKPFRKTLREKILINDYLFLTMQSDIPCRGWVLKQIIIVLLSLAVMITAPTTLAAGWDWQNPLPTGNQINGMQFVNANLGYAVGNCGTILKTADGGTNWSILSSGTTSHLNAVSFVDASTGWVVGAGGVILKTADGGATWDLQTKGTTLNGVFFIDANNGWAVGDTGLILRTTDGGANWGSFGSPTSNSLKSVHFADASYGWAAGAAGTIAWCLDDQRRALLERPDLGGHRQPERGAFRLDDPWLGGGRRRRDPEHDQFRVELERADQ